MILVILIKTILILGPQVSINDKMLEKLVNFLIVLKISFAISLRMKKKYSSKLSYY